MTLVCAQTSVTGINSTMLGNVPVRVKLAGPASGGVGLLVRRHAVTGQGSMY